MQVSVIFLLKLLFMFEVLAQTSPERLPAGTGMQESGGEVLTDSKYADITSDYGDTDENVGHHFSFGLFHTEPHSISDKGNNATGTNRVKRWSDDRHDRYNDRYNRYDNRNNRYSDRRHRYSSDDRHGRSDDRYHRSDERRDRYDDRYHRSDERRDRYDDKNHRSDERRDRYDDRYHRSDERRDRYDDKYHRSDEHRGRSDDRNHRSDERRGRYRHRYNNNGRSKYYMTHIEMPSTRMVNITDPPYSRKWTCKAKLLDLAKNSDEFDIVSHEVNNFPVGSPVVRTIDRVEKIYNNCLWKRYRYRRGVLNDEFGDAAVQQKMLYFVGNSSAIDDLIARGFDERSLDLSSSDYGAGWVFSTSPVKSNALAVADTNGFKVTIGRPIDLTVATKYAHPPVDHESVHVGNEYAIYRNEQVYPEFLVTYT